MPEESNPDSPNVPPHGHQGVKLHFEKSKWKEYLMVFAFGLLLGLALSG